jgi:hypothetical protein
VRRIWRGIGRLSTAASRDTLNYSTMPPDSELRVDVTDATLIWGNPARWKAALREESERRHLDLPPGERLRRALALVLPQAHDRERASR